MITSYASSTDPVARAAAAAAAADAAAALAATGHPPGDAVIDLRGHAGGSVVGQVLQDALFAVRAAQFAAGQIWPTSVLLPVHRDPLFVDRTIYTCVGDLTIAGESPGARAGLKWANYSGAPLLDLGFDPTPAHDVTAPRIPDAHRPPLGPLLDGSVSNRHGYRTYSSDRGSPPAAYDSGVTALTAALNALNCGPEGWEDLDFFGLNLAVADLRDDGNPRPLAVQSGALCGIGDALGASDLPVNPSPVLLRVVGTNVVQLSILTQDSPLPHVWEFSLGSTTGVVRISPHVDLDTGAVYAVGNRDNGGMVYLALTQVDNSMTASAPLTPGTRFVPNPENPWNFGRAVKNLDGVDPYGAVSDRTLLGHRTLQAPYYPPGSTGSAATPIGGGADTDLRRYFENGAGSLSSATIALIPFDLAPAATKAKGRELTVKHGGWDTQGIYPPVALIRHPGLTALRIPTAVAVAHLDLTAGPRFGACIMQGPAINVNLGESNLNGGWHTIGNSPKLANYQHRYRDLVVQGGTRAGIYNSFGSLDMVGVRFLYQPRGLWLSESTGVTFKDIFFAPPGGTTIRNLFELVNDDGGGLFTLENALLDFEGGDAGGTGGPTNALVSLTNNNYVGVGVVKLKEVAAGSMGRRACVLELIGDRNLPGSAEIENCRVDGWPFRSVVRTTGKQWGLRWHQDDRTVCQITDAIEATDGDPGQSIDIRLSGHVGPFTTRGWTAGTACAVNHGPGPGQFARWSCAGTGAYGTATPPSWVGLDRARSGDPTRTYLAAYAVDHTHGSATLTGDLTPDRPPRGLVGVALKNRLLNKLLRNASDTAPVVKAALSTWDPNAVGRFPEFSPIDGYARVTVPGSSWTAVGTSLSLTTPIVLPTPTAPWIPAWALGLIDQNNDDVLASLGLGGKILAPSQSPAAPTFSAASFARAHLSSPHGMVTDTIWLAALSYFFKGTAWTPPAALYLGLSASAASAAGTVVEPSGGGYARVALGSNPFAFVTDGTTSNVNAIGFATPTGSWGLVRSAAIFDAATGGTVVATVDLTDPITPDTTTPAPTFAAGALWIGVA